MSRTVGEVRSEHRQTDFAVRLDWGRTGAAAISDEVDAVVVVDVLSFSTTVSVAVDAGIAIIPCRWGDERAAGLAAEQGAVLAVGRRAALGTDDRISLSPASVRAAVDAGTAPSRLVLPSPNGSTITADVAASGAVCVAGCLRNPGAVAAWLTDREDITSIAVVAAGERWPDGSLRPAVEDGWGAGAVIDALVARGWHGLSPEGASARAGYLAICEDIGPALLASASGRELAAGGFAQDVAIAAEVGSSSTVPVLSANGFTAVPRE